MFISRGLGIFSVFTALTFNVWCMDSPEPKEKPHTQVQIDTVILIFGENQRVSVPAAIAQTSLKLSNIMKKKLAVGHTSSTIKIKVSIESQQWVHLLLKVMNFIHKQQHQPQINTLITLTKSLEDGGWTSNLQTISTCLHYASFFKLDLFESACFMFLLKNPELLKAYRETLKDDKRELQLLAKKLTNTAQKLAQNDFFIVEISNVQRIILQRSVLKQSATLDASADMIKNGLEKTYMIKKPSLISSEIMNWVALKLEDIYSYTKRGRTPYGILRGLCEYITGETRVFENITLFLEYLVAAEFFDVKFMKSALYSLIAENENLHQGCLAAINNFHINRDDFNDNVAKAYLLKYKMYLKKPDGSSYNPVIELEDLHYYGIVEGDIPLQESEFYEFISSLLNQKTGIQTGLINLLPLFLKYKETVRFSALAFNEMVQYLNTLPLKKLEDLLEKWDGNENSYVTIAVQLVAAKRFNKNIGTFDCVTFVKNITNRINNNEAATFMSELLREDLLEFVLPLLEPILEIEVTELDLNDLELSKVPQEICLLQKLSHLDLFLNNIESLPRQFSYLDNLTFLDLSDNESLNKIPACILQMKSLITLHMSNTGLESIPDDVKGLVNVHFLNLSNNRIKFINQNICQLQSLETLKLLSNKIRYVPDCLFDLGNLKTVYIDPGTQYAGKYASKVMHEEESTEEDEDGDKDNDTENDEVDDEEPSNTDAEDEE